MKTLYNLFILLFLTQTLSAQTTHNISMGASYANGEYYNLTSDATTSVAHTAWDIAFSVYGTTDAGVFINEGSAFMGTAPKLYLVPNKNFSDNITSSDFGDQLKNTEKAWNEGAFNSVKNPANWMDLGWGTYNPSNHAITGSKLYVVELSNGTHKKLSIDSLVGGTYHFQYADLDGSNLQQKTIAKSDYNNQTLAYFSFTTNAAASLEPTTGWDWLLTRYETVVDNNGTPTPYTVGGILVNQGVEAVIADNITPATVDIANYTLHDDSLTTIGHDWKSFGFGSGWSVDADRVYFIKTFDNNLYKVQFVDFQGSSTGQGTFLKTSLGQWTALEKINGVFESFQAYPNPANEIVNIAFSLTQDQSDLELRVVDMLGRTVVSELVQGTNGLNALTLNTASLNAGNYVVQIQHAGKVVSQKLTIQ